MVLLAWLLSNGDEDEGGGGGGGRGRYEDEDEDEGLFDDLLPDFGDLIPDFGGIIEDIMAPLMQICKSASSGMIASSVCLSCLLFGFLMVQIILKFV